MKLDLDKIKASKTTEELLEFGIINIDKPMGPTSFTVSEFVKKTLGLRKTSHFGTLDPMVTGVLPVALNRACKLTGHFLGEDKTYVGTMLIHTEVPQETLQKIIAEQFSGTIAQLPPVRSRVKRAVRDRTIHQFNILEQDKREILFAVTCQGGTYIRKLVSDLGEALKTGAHMMSLRRTDAGIFSELDAQYPAITLYAFERAVEKYHSGDDTELRAMIIPGEIITELYPAIFVKERAVEQLYTGKPFIRSDVIGTIPQEKVVVVFHEQTFIGIYEQTNSEKIIARPLFVLQPIADKNDKKTKK